uniref:G protein-coupled receptor kinase interacting ArfGAP 2a n=1 Tax=Astyanax mexicanus TaxID=7994 RepID=A0A8B9KGY9_ASTMX
FFFKSQFSCILASYPHWASVNRAVLICDQCCSVHRSLGRHSSQIRHLVHTVWSPTQLQMVRTLFKSGSNSIWEHSLQDSSSAASGRKKNIPQDKLHPNKAEFIRAKYQMLAFILRMPCRDDDSCTAKDLSKQLHSSVRTGNLETSLRLLSLGAQANFFHPEKGNTPLHVAAKAGQVSQVELLSVYGADPGAPDANGNTPIEYARQAGHPDLADRLVEIQYELTDRLAFYLCGRRPDHKNGQHFIIPQLLSNRLFEELAMDVYDEVDRRETDAVWLTTQSHSTLVAEAVIVPFLPVNPEYSSTRNQGRQKLARFNAHEFATLIIDILSDAMRRQHGNSATSPKDELILKRASSRHASDSQEPDQPDYDSVASDEDTDAEVHPAKTGRAKVRAGAVSKADKQSSVSEGDYDNTVHDSELEDPGLDGKSRLQGLGWGEGPDGQEAEPNTALPATEDVIQKTEQITKNIQALLKAAQESQPGRSEYTTRPLYQKHLLSLTPPIYTTKPRSESVGVPLRLLKSRAQQLQLQCRKTSAQDGVFMQQIIQCAYDIARAAKQLVTVTTKENSK